VLGSRYGSAGAESLTLSTPVTRLLAQWLEHSSVTRAHAPAQLRGELWVLVKLTKGFHW
jgi:hypothetical protein